MHIIYIYIHIQKRISLTLEEGVKKNKKRNEETGKQKLNEMGILNIKQKKWNKLDESKRSPYSPVVFNYGGSLESHLSSGGKKKSIPGLLYLKNNSKKILIRICIFKMITGFSIKW